MSRQTNINFGEFGDYSSGEVAYIIELLSAMQTPEEIQEAFYRFTEGRRGVRGEVIQMIQIRFSDRIKRQSEVYLNNIEGNPLAHLRVRLDIAYKIMKDSLRLRPSHTIKRGEDDYEVVMKSDNVTALNALKLAMQDLTKREELDNVKLKKAQVENLNELQSEWEIDDGLTA